MVFCTCIGSKVGHQVVSLALPHIALEWFISIIRCIEFVSSSARVTQKETTRSKIGLQGPIKTCHTPCLIIPDMAGFVYGSNFLLDIPLRRRRQFPDSVSLFGHGWPSESCFSIVCI